MKGEFRQSESRVGGVFGTMRNGQDRLYFWETWVRWVGVKEYSLFPPQDRTGLLQKAFMRLNETKYMKAN